MDNEKRELKENAVKAEKTAGNTPQKAAASEPQEAGARTTLETEVKHPREAAGKTPEETALKAPGKTAVQERKGPGSKKKRKKKGKKLLIVLVIVLLGLIGGFLFLKKQREKAAASASGDVQTAEATRMDITSELTASSSLSPKDTYEVTSLVEGEILTADFEEGDIVEKGQILYTIDSSSVNSDLSSAETSLTRAQENLKTAQEDYNEAVALLSGNIYKSTIAGYVKTLYVDEGDKVSNGTKIADIYDDSIMELKVPYLSADADAITVGQTAVITLEDTAEQIEGTVSNVSSLETTLTGGRLVKNVTIQVQNPGGLTSSMQATAEIGGLICAAEGTFTAKTEYALSADLNGNANLEIETLLVFEGSRVEVGTGLFTATADSAEDYRKNFKDSLENAEDNLQTAENKLSDTQDNIGDYTITAPISGTIVTKTSKVGDKISRNSSSTTTMCVIYDLSSMTLEMSVDELDVGDVAVGQQVEITADAIEDETFYGTVTNVSLQGSYSNGVTNYPVTVTLEETGDLRPGMNVDAKIILDSSSDALVIPAGALMRGNRVYVKDTDGASSETAAAVATDVDKTAAPEGSAAGAGAGAGAESGESPQGGGAFDGQAPDGAQAGSDTEGGASDSMPAAAGSSQGMPSNVPSGFHAVTVTTGIINDDYVEILSGLSEGDVVYVDPNAGTTATMNWGMGGGFGEGGMGGGPGGGGGMGGGPGGGGGRP